jgi:hypothetical protein
MRRDGSNLGRVSPTAKWVSSRWHQLTSGGGLYQPLRDGFQNDVSGIEIVIDSARTWSRQLRFARNRRRAARIAGIGVPAVPRREVGMVV